MAGKRNRATAIIETKKGILIVRIRGLSYFVLPGGGIDKGESTIAALKRELKEETNLIATSCKYLFDSKGGTHTFSGKIMQNQHRVFLVKAKGKAIPKSEIKSISYYKRNSKIKLSKATRSIISKYRLAKR